MMESCREGNTGNEMIINCSGCLIKKKTVYHGLELSYRFPSIESCSFFDFYANFIEVSRKQKSEYCANYEPTSQLCPLL